MELKSDIMWEFNKEKKLGHIRCDFDRGRASKPFSTWFKSDNMQYLVKKHSIDLKKIDSTINCILESKIDSYDKVVELCGGKIGYSAENSVYLQRDECNYWIRLIPVKEDYNIYISVYTQ